MVDKLYFNILDRERMSVLPHLAFLKNRFYLAGGTALALQIGHRTSIDFDFFTENTFDNSRLFLEIEENFDQSAIEITQNLKDTLTIVLDKSVKISLFRTPYPVILPLIESNYLWLLPEIEIGVMKLIALTRAAYRDYVDLYFILKKYSLQEIIILAREKYKNFDEGIYLKCLLFYDDIEISPLQLQKGFVKKRKEIFSFIEQMTWEYLKEK